jgi:hypothetical protein
MNFTVVVAAITVPGHMVGGIQLSPKGGTNVTIKRVLGCKCIPTAGMMEARKSSIGMVPSVFGRS